MLERSRLQDQCFCFCGPRLDATFEFFWVTATQTSTEREDEEGWADLPDRIIRVFDLWCNLNTPFDNFRDAEDSQSCGQGNPHSSVYELHSYVQVG